MAELDRFEARFEAAYLRYLEEAPIEVNAAAVARVVAAEAPRRRAFPDLRPLRLSPALAWLLLALLLATVLLGGLLVAGSQLVNQWPAVVPPVAPIAGCPPGSTPDVPGEGGQAGPVADGLLMAFDRRAGKVVALARHYEGGSDRWETWTFDVCTNAWARPGPRLEPGPLPYAHIVYDVDSDVTIAIGSDSTPWVYDLETNRWSSGDGPAEPDLSQPFPPRSFQLVYDPVSGLVFAQVVVSGDQGAESQELWTYDVESDAWAKIEQSGTLPPGPSGDHRVLTFDTSVDRIVAVGANQSQRSTHLLDPRMGTWAAASRPPIFNTGYVGSRGEGAYDEASERSFVFSDGWIAAYDAAVDRWDSRSSPDVEPYGTGPLNRLGHWMVYDPLNERLVVAGGTYRTSDGSVRADDVWAYDPAVDGWIRLVAPSRVERLDAETESWTPVPESDRP